MYAIKSKVTIKSWYNHSKQEWIYDNVEGYVKFCTRDFPTGSISGHDSAKCFETEKEAKHYMVDAIRNCSQQDADFIIETWSIVPYKPPYNKYGQIAALDKKQLSDNPYEIDSEAFNEWNIGWNEFHNNRKAWIQLD